MFIAISFSFSAQRDDAVRAAKDGPYVMILRDESAVELAFFRRDDAPGREFWQMKSLFFRRSVRLLDVPLRKFLERFPLRRVMPEDDERHAFALYQLRQFMDAPMEPGLVQLALEVFYPFCRIEIFFECGGIDGEQDWPGLRQADQHS